MLDSDHVEEGETSMSAGSDSPRTRPDSIQVVNGPKLRSGVPIVSGFMPASALIPDGYQIPTYDPRTGKGYQRPSQEGRVNELVADLKKNRVDLPTAVLLNLRNREPRHVLGNNELKLHVLGDSGSHQGAFHIVDGQHRILAFQKLMEEQDGAKKWGGFLIPFVCMVGASEAEEMELFYVVNSRAKPVRTDLALALLRKLSDRDHKFLERLEEKGKDWQVPAEKLTESMAENSSLWRGLIRLAAMDKGKSTLASASMVTSLKPLLASSFFSRLSFDQQQLVLETFWRGLREIMRPAFDEPQEYVIQKGVGVNVMHAILVDVLEIVRSAGQSVIEPEIFTSIMRGPIEKLQGEAQDGVGTPVEGTEFWRIAPRGAAGSYSSSAGRRVLIAKLRQQLPNVEAV